MKPEIEAYLREHGATYTSDALRKELIAAGHDAAEVDAALQEWEAERAQAVTGAAAGETERRAFRRWALWLHVGALVAMVALLLLLNGTSAAGFALVGGVVLAIALLIGWVVSTVIGGALLPRTGLTVALVVPLISAVALGGTCLALMDAATPTPPTPGFVELRVEAPMTFEGSGAADCYLREGDSGFSVFARYLGTHEGREVSFSIDVFQVPTDDPNAPAPAPAPGAGESNMGVNVAFHSPSESGTSISYANIFNSELDLDASADGRSGTITFAGLVADAEDPAAPRPEPISGTATWTCEGDGS